MSDIIFWTALGTMAGLLVAAVGFAAFWRKEGANYATVAAAAENAKEHALEAKVKADALTIALAMHEKMAAAQFAHLDTLVAGQSKDIIASEARLTAAIEKMSARFDVFTSEVTRRIDDVGKTITDVVTAAASPRQGSHGSS
jgi:signal transduction protein with GAF and PtsI domain